MYGLDSFILTPPFSILASILLIFSCDALGVYITRILGFEVRPIKWMRWQAPIIGAALLSVIFYPFALLGIAYLSVFKFVAFFLIAISLLHLVLMGKEYKNYIYKMSCWLKSYFFWKILLLCLMLSYFLLTLSPITNADSLDYHVGTALHILNNGSMPVTPEWFHSRLSGNGEVLNAIGFSIGAEQFGSLLQLTGLVGIVGLIYHAVPSLKNKHNESWRLLLVMAAVSAPVLLFLIGSVKPQLLPIGMTSFALALCLFPSMLSLDKQMISKTFVLICMLVMVASQAKISFLLGGGLVGFLAIYIMAKNKLYIPMIIIGCTSFLFIILPPIAWKVVHFGGGWVESLVTPFPGDWYGTAEFETSLRNYRDSIIWFPFSLIVPSGLGVLSTIIGIGVGLFIFVKPTNEQPLKVVVVLSAVFIIIAATFGPPTSRSYLEPYFWLLMVLGFQGIPNAISKCLIWFQGGIVLQSFLTLSMCWYGIVSSLPGALTSSGRISVMENLANGYSVMRWVDSTVPANAVVLSEHRAIGLVPRKAVSLDWMKHIEADKVKSTPYLYQIKNNGVTHLLVQGENYKESEYVRFYSSCLTGKAIKSDLLPIATRNPFNKGREYVAWLIPFNANLLPDCVLKTNE